MRNAIVVGGSSGIGLSITVSLKGYNNVYIIDRQGFTPPRRRIAVAAKAKQMVAVLMTVCSTITSRSTC